MVSSKKNRSQIDRPWIVFLSLQIQFRTGKRRLSEKVVETLAGPWRGHCSFQHLGFLAQGMDALHDHFIH